MRQEGSPQQHQKRNENLHRKVKQDEGHGRPFPSAQGDFPWAVAAPGDDRVLLAVLHQPYVKIGEDQAGQEHDRAIGARDAVVGQAGRRIGRSEDQGAQHEDPRRKSDNRRDFEDSERGHEEINHHPGNRGQSDRDVDSQEGLKLAHPRGVGRLFKRRVHRAVGRRQHEERRRDE